MLILGLSEIFIWWKTVYVLYGIILNTGSNNTHNPSRFPNEPASIERRALGLNSLH